MRINLGKVYVPQAGDILSWISGEEKILFVVLENGEESEDMKGVTLIDSRYSYRNDQTHTICLIGEEVNYRLHLICKRERVYYDLDQILKDWRTQNE